MGCKWGEHKKGRTMKLAEDNIGESICGLGDEDFLSIILNPQTTRKKISKFDYIRIKGFCQLRTQRNC